MLALVCAEIDQWKAGVRPLEDNPLVNAPHTERTGRRVAHPYSREVAVFPAGVAADKYWADGETSG